MQRFRAIGLGAFAGISSDPAHLSNKGYDYSYGGGLRAGIEWSLMPNVRLGLSGQTPDVDDQIRQICRPVRGRRRLRHSGQRDRRRRLGCDAEPDADGRLQAHLLRQHRLDRGIRSRPGSLGSANGPGFGWHDIDIIKLGVEWRASPVWTLRAGYAHNTNPIKSSDVTFNILAPGVVTDTSPAVSPRR